MSAFAAYVSAKIPLFVLKVAEGFGVSQDALAKSVGLERDELLRPEARVPLDAELALWREAARMTGDPLFGLRAAEAWRPGEFDVFEYVCRSAGTLRDAVERVIRYNRLLHDIAEFRLEEAGDEALVVHRFRGELVGPVRVAADFTLASVLLMGRAWTGRSSLNARRVAFMHLDPSGLETLRAFFGTRHIELGAKEGLVVLDRSVLDLPLVAFDPALASMLERHVDAMIAALPKAEGFGARLRELIANELRRGGSPTVPMMAKRLHMSERSLHRRLAEAGLSFRDEIDSIRRGLALRYLEESRIQIAEVAFLLGYSEARAFHRAFKAWTGETPGAYRERIGAE